MISFLYLTQARSATTARRWFVVFASRAPLRARRAARLLALSRAHAHRLLAVCVSAWRARVRVALAWGDRVGRVVGLWRRRRVRRAVRAWRAWTGAREHDWARVQTAVAHHRAHTLSAVFCVWVQVCTLPCVCVPALMSKVTLKSRCQYACVWVYCGHISVSVSACVCVRRTIYCVCVVAVFSLWVWLF